MPTSSSGRDSHPASSGLQLAGWQQQEQISWADYHSSFGDGRSCGVRGWDVLLKRVDYHCSFWNGRGWDEYVLCRHFLSYVKWQEKHTAVYEINLFLVDGSVDSIPKFHITSFIKPFKQKTGIL